MPKGYRGLVLSQTDRTLSKPQPTNTIEEDEDFEEVSDVKIVEEQSEFSEIMIWGHEALPDEMADPYIRGVEEWIAFAETVRYPFREVESFC